MLSWKHLIAGFFLLSNVSGTVFAAARLEPLTVGYSNFTGTYAPLWIAVDEQVGAKYGLDLTAIYAGRVRPQKLLATDLSAACIRTDGRRRARS